MKEQITTINNDFINDFSNIYLDPSKVNKYLNNYSTIIEKMSPKIAVHFLNEYYSAIHNVIINYGGMVLNYVGDSVMVAYGAPQVIENHEESAVKAAIKIREKLKFFLSLSAPRWL